MSFAKTGAIALILTGVATAAFADDSDQTAERTEFYRVLDAQPAQAAPMTEGRQAVAVTQQGGLSQFDKLRVEQLDRDTSTN